MSAPTPAPRFTLRQLSIPAKLVVTTFLLAVGLGYTSAMVQLHMQHSDRDGTPMPTVENVVAVFAGKKLMKPGGEAEPTKSALEAIISGSPKGDLTSKNMTPAFFHEDGADFTTLAEKNPAQLPKLEAERDGERNAMIAWINSAPESRREAYDSDKFKLPKNLVGKPLSNAYKPSADVVQIRSILRDRCVRCHKPGGEKQDVPLTTYEELTKYMPKEIAAPENGGYVDSGKQISLEKLTQSTHAHLLTFAVLFGITGFIFAHTSYSGLVRGVIGPIVLAAQVADISCWWLARLDAPLGPYFAMCIIGTGGIVGLGLSAQIVLSLFNMYGPKGKAVLLLLFLLAGAAGGVVAVKVAKPFLDDQRMRAESKKAANANGNGKVEDKGKAPTPGPAAPVAPVVANGPSRLEELLTGTYPDAKWGKAAGGMVQAFFDKDNEFKKAVKDADDAEKKKLIAEREGERQALLAWAKAGEDIRKKAFEEDHFLLPKGLAGQPITEDFKLKDDCVKIALLLETRCARCHTDGGSKEEIPLDKYEHLLKYLAPSKGVAAKPADQAANAIPMADE